MRLCWFLWCNFQICHLPLHPVVCRAATKSFHLCLSWAILVSESHECFITFISVSTVLLHVSLGLPLFLFPSGVQCNAVLTVESGFLRSTCPIHLQRLRDMIVPMSSCLHLLKRSSLDIFSGQNILRILRRHVVWKERSMLSSVAVILQHSDPYSSTDIT